MTMDKQLDFERTHSKPGDPVTAKLAAARAGVRWKGDAARVYWALAQRLPGGLTDEELIRETGLYSANRRRCTLFKHGGYVRDMGEVRTTKRGCPAIVWGIDLHTPLWIGGEPPEGKGDCMEASYGAVHNVPDSVRAWLVHGVVTGTGGETEGKQFAHAWVEIEEPPEELAAHRKRDSALAAATGTAVPSMNKLPTTLCINVANGNMRAVPRPLFYGVGEVSYTVRYTAAEAMGEAHSSGHYGPWRPEFGPGGLVTV